MPSRLIHFYIANEILKKVKLDRNMFILGSIAPDAHDRTTKGRYSTHFEIANDIRGTEYPVSDLGAFLKKYLLKADDFILGYYFHLFVDNMWFPALYNEFILYDSEEEKSSKIDLCYQDYGALDRIVIKHFCLEKEKLIIPQSIVVEEVTTEQLLQLTKNLYNDFEFSYIQNTLSIFNESFIIDFINNSSEKCINEMNNLKEFIVHHMP